MFKRKWHTPDQSTSMGVTDKICTEDGEGIAALEVKRQRADDDQSFKLVSAASGQRSGGEGGRGFSFSVRDKRVCINGHQGADIARLRTETIAKNARDVLLQVSPFDESSNPLFSIPHSV